MTEPNTKETEFLSPAKAAEILYVHPQTLRRYEKDGLLTVSRTSGGHRRYKKEDIQNLKLYLKDQVGVHKKHNSKEIKNKIINELESKGVDVTNINAEDIRPLQEYFPKSLSESFLIPVSINGDISQCILSKPLPEGFEEEFKLLYSLRQTPFDHDSLEAGELMDHFINSYNRHNRMRNKKEIIDATIAQAFGDLVFSWVTLLMFLTAFFISLSLIPLTVALTGVFLVALGIVLISAKAYKITLQTVFKKVLSFYITPWKNLYQAGVFNRNKEFFIKALTAEQYEKLKKE